jgi:hypothetical protein
MTMVQIDRSRPSGAFGHQKLAVIATLRKMLASVSSSSGETWHSLNEHHLRDIGRSPADAEIARITAGLGVSAWSSSIRTPLV